MNPDIIQLQSLAGEVAKLLKTMSNPHRLLILCMLIDSPGTSAGELSAITGLSPSATSQHLTRMLTEGWIENRRDAQRILYAIKDDAVRQVISTLKNLYCP